MRKNLINIATFVVVLLLYSTHPGCAFRPFNATKPPTLAKVRPRGLINITLETKPVPRTIKFYYDYTSEINQILDGDNEINRTIGQRNDSVFEMFNKAKSTFSNDFILYSTDALITDMLSISPVTDLLSDKISRNSTLLLSFQFIKNGEFDKRRLQDVLQGISQTPTFDEIQRQSLRRQVSGIILDWSQSRKYPCDWDQNDPVIRYFEKMNISFTKYAQRIAGILLGSPNSSARVKVGVAYTEKQIHPNCHFLRSQVLAADFVVVGVTFNSESKFPLTNKALNSYMDSVSQENNIFLNGPMSGSKTNSTAPKKLQTVNYLITLENEALYVPYGGIDNEKDIDRGSPDQCLPILKNFIWSWAIMKEGTNQIVFRSFDYQNEHFIASTFKKYFELSSKSAIIPYLYLHETDVSSCALRAMIEEMSWYPDVVINEYTWNAIVNHESGMELDGDLTTRKCVMRSPSQFHAPENIHLFVSDGVGVIWNQINETLEKSLVENHSAAGMTLQTVVFSATDIRYTACGEHCSPQRLAGKTNLSGITEFAEKIQRSSNVSIGCLVDFGQIESESRLQLTRFMNETTFVECGTVTEISSVFVWRFTINPAQHDSSNLSFDSNSRYGNSLKFKLLNLVQARKEFMDQNKGIEVIIQFIPKEDFFRWADKKFYCSRVYDFYDALVTWGHIHGMRFVVRPIFDVQNPMFGLNDVPNDNGKLRHNDRSNFCRGYKTLNGTNHQFQFQSM